MPSDPTTDPEAHSHARAVLRAAARLAGHWLARGARLHVQRRITWTDFPRSEALAYVGMSLLGAAVCAALLLSGIGALPSIAFAAISMAGMEQSMRIVRDPRWMVAYAGAGLTGLMAALAAWMVSPLAGTLIGFVALATAVRLVLAALATVR